VHLVGFGIEKRRTELKHQIKKVCILLVYIT